MTNSTPKVAQKKSYPVEVEAGKNYAWCSCGLSQKQPFCDGTHSGTSFKPHVFKAEESKTLYLCGCKYTNKTPYCDGSHKAL
jgi:CDGSH-type Zn-finger protein